MPACAVLMSSAMCLACWQALRAEHVSSFSSLCREWSVVCLHVLREPSICVHVSAHIEG